MVFGVWGVRVRCFSERWAGVCTLSDDIIGVKRGGKMKRRMGIPMELKI